MAWQDRASSVFNEHLFFGQLQLIPPILEFLIVLQLVKLAAHMTKKGGPTLALHPLHQLRLQPDGDTGSPLVLLTDLFCILTGSAHLASLGVVGSSPALIVLGTHTARDSFVIATLFGTFFSHRLILILFLSFVKKTTAGY